MSRVLLRPLLFFAPYVFLSLLPEMVVAQVPGIVEADETLDAALLGATVSAPITKQVDVFALGGYRVGQFDFGFATAGVKYNPNKNISFGAAYFGLFLEDSPNRPNPRDNRLRLDAEVRRTFGKITLQHRSRFEYRTSDVGDGWRWRPELRASTKFNLRGRDISPFVLVEPTYEFRTNEVAAVLTHFGAATPLGNGFVIEPSFLRAAIRDGADLNFYTIFLKYRY